MPDTPKLKRWMIRGTLTTLTPLHVGDGSVVGAKPEVAAVVRDHSRQPYIPGSGLRGFLRNCAEQLVSEDQVKQIFGFQDQRITTPVANSPEKHAAGSSIAKRASQGADAQGGVLHVWDATARQAIETVVQNHVVINRRTRTAQDRLLFAEELVPEGTSFELCLVIEGERASESDVQLLLGILNRLHDCGQRLGAGTADHLGHVKWIAGEVRALNDTALQNWLKNGGSLNDHLQVVKVQPEQLNLTRRRLIFDIELHFEDRFLVKDAELSKNKEKGKNLKNSAIEARRRDGKALLDASSFFGALRSQCERIARTLAGPQADTWVRNVEASGAGFHPLNQYTAVDCLFGGVGWRSPLRVEEVFVARDKTPPTKQEFLAIDRFTGGGVDGLKYDACGFERPVIRGKLSLDLASLKALHAKGANPKVFADNDGSFADLFLLLAFTLRDLEEGDIRFGFGASKGYGACRAKIGWDLPQAYSPTELVQYLTTLLSK
jgi:CRISPR/Cas system CSM-associated protein Csm3 (group 7 of RAMP superfamily)